MQGGANSGNFLFFFKSIGFKNHSNFRNPTFEILISRLQTLASRLSLLASIRYTETNPCSSPKNSTFPEPSLW